MDVDCVSLPDAPAAPADADDAGHGHGLGALLAAARTYPKGGPNAGGVHELLECPVCTNSMFPPIHQVRLRQGPVPRAPFFLLPSAFVSIGFLALERSSLTLGGGGGSD
jgi:hypothetical protein